jgi:hypothetical protein
MAEKVLLATYNGNTDASGVPTDVDAKVIYEVMQDLGLEVDVVHQWVFNPNNSLYMKETDHERYDGIIYANIYGYWDFTELVASRRPFLTTCASATPAVALGNATREHSHREMFNIVNTSHSITSGLPSGSVDIGNAMWVDSVWTQNKKVDVLIEGESGDDVLVTHKDKRYAFFGFYRLSQAGGSGDVDVRDLLSRTIRWILG